MNFTKTLVSFAVVSLHAVSSNVQGEDAASSTNLKSLRSAFETYCVDCHSSVEPTAKLDLEAFDTSQALSNEPWDTTRWEKIVKRLRARQMPPPDADRPTEDEYKQLLATMETTLQHAAEKFRQPGRTDPIRRLNRTEYRNAIRDLLDLEVDVKDLLPADQLSHGFDNITLTELSPALLNRYITAAELISRTAIGRAPRSPGGVTVRLPADRTQEYDVEGLPLGTRGGTLLKHHFPVTGEYEIQLRLMRDRDENIEGLREQHDIDVLVDRGLIHRFTVRPPKSGEGYQRDDTLVDANLKKRFRVAAGPHSVGVTFPQKFSSLSEIKRQPFDANFNRHRHPRLSPAIFEVSIVGPFDAEGPGDTPSRRKIFATPSSRSNDSSQQAEDIFRQLMRIAYRRPVVDEDLVVPMQFYRERTSDGFEAGIASGLAAILVNPHFLFRTESTPKDIAQGSIYRISGLELASRLSFFLWSSLPDDELLSLAEAGRLHEPTVLKAQVDRMLRDRRSDSLATIFAAQWLYLRNLDSFKPDMRLFPDFDDNLRKALRRETELLFAHVVREDLSVLKLLGSNTTFLNERLAKHYGIRGVLGSHFRPVDVSDKSLQRGGLLRHGSILAVTSYATRTSPTIRGSWILENILGTPPPPPPPNVPALKEKKTSSDATVRERLAEHRENPACASCHDLMDPVGFALENFDAVGRWRLFDQGLPIDSTGSMPDGKSITGLEDLEAGIMDRPEMFVGTLAEKLLTFALGRGIESYDGPAIRTIVEQSADNEYRFSSLIKEIVESTPFQMRVAE